MNWMALLSGIAGAVIGYVAGATRAHIANQSHLDQLNRWIERQAPGARPPLDRSDP
jgi:hypothetical protein